MSVDVTTAGVALGFDCKYRATTPATCGDAIDVPDIEVRSVVLRMYDDVMETPGANTSTHEPKFEKLARASVEPVAPTVIADGALAGQSSRRDRRGGRSHRGQALHPVRDRP